MSEDNVEITRWTSSVLILIGMECYARGYMRFPEAYSSGLWYMPQ